MNDRCSLNLSRERNEALKVLVYHPPDLRRKWRTLIVNGVALGVGLVLGLGAFLAWVR